MGMSTVLELPTVESQADDESLGVSADEFQALEQKVLRAVEIVRREREARASAEAEIEVLRHQLDMLTTASNESQLQITALNQERDVVRQRVEKMLRQMDELL